jgi:hypothetical protein
MTTNDLSPLAHWMLKHSDVLGLKVFEIQNLITYLPNFVDIEAEIKINGSTFRGRALDSKTELAIEKAVTEALERAICLSYLPNTNGVAAHPDATIAKQKALEELLERDLFLCHFLTNSTLFPRPDLLTYVPQKAVADAQLLGHEIGFFSSTPSNLGTTLVCLITGKQANQPFGCILGLSFDSFKNSPAEKGNSAFKAFIEAYRQYRWHLDLNLLTESISLNDFSRIDQPTFRDHIKLALNNEYFAKIEHIFSKNPLKPKRQISYDSCSFEFFQISSASLNLADCPIKVYACVEPTAQKLKEGYYEENALSKRNFGKLWMVEKRNIAA